MKTPVKFLAATLALLLAGDRLDAGVIYDAAADFSATSNPNGVWSYGQSATLTSAFQLYTQAGVDNADPPPANLLDTWNAGTGGMFVVPAVLHNGTSGTVSIYGGAITFAPGQLALHPGSLGEYSVVRFTAPTAGQYTYYAEFMGLDVHATTDVHVLLNNAFQMEAFLTGRQGAGAGQIVTLASGDTLDFKVGYGANQNYISDTTGLGLTITADFAQVPEPASLVLMGIGLVGFGGLHWRRRKALAV